MNKCEDTVLAEGNPFYDPSTAIPYIELCDECEGELLATANGWEHVAEANYRLRNLGEHGVSVTIDGFTCTFSAMADALRFVLDNRIPLEREHASIAEALGVK